MGKKTQIDFFLFRLYSPLNSFERPSAIQQRAILPVINSEYYPSFAPPPPHSA